MAKKRDTRARIAEAIRDLAVPIQELAADPHNAKVHTEPGIAAIAAGLKEFGQYAPIIVNASSGVIACGTGRYLAALKLGWSHLAAVQLKLSTTKHRLLALADNRLAEFSTWDRDQVLLDQALLMAELPDSKLTAALLIDDLLGTQYKAKPKPAPPKFEIVVRCDDGQTQQKLLERLRAEGYQARGVAK